MFGGVLGLRITQKRRPRLHAVAAQFLLGIAGVALITFVCFKIGFGVGRTSLAYLIWIALVSLLGSFGVSVVLSIVAVACLNYFFVPPLFEIRVDDPDDIVRMAVFLTTSLLVTALTAKAAHEPDALSKLRRITRRMVSSCLTIIRPLTSTVRPALVWATAGKS